MKTNTIFGEDFLLQSDAAKKLYHNHAAHLPIIDYHNHLPVKEIAENKSFENLTDIWLRGDHYKWRAMRTLGVNEIQNMGGFCPTPSKKSIVSLDPYGTQRSIWP